MSVNTESIEAAARALHEFNPTFAQDKWDATELDYRSWRREQAAAALTAAAPFIQAAALREFAHALTAMITVYAERTTEYDAGWVAGMTSAIAGLTARADQLEGESE